MNQPTRTTPNHHPLCISAILLHKYAECHSLPLAIWSVSSFLKKGVSLLQNQVSGSEGAEPDHKHQAVTGDQQMPSS